MLDYSALDKLYEAHHATIDLAEEQLDRAWEGIRSIYVNVATELLPKAWKLGGVTYGDVGTVHVHYSADGEDRSLEITGIRNDATRFRDRLVTALKGMGAHA